MRVTKSLLFTKVWAPLVAVIALANVAGACDGNDGSDEDRHDAVDAGVAGNGSDAGVILPPEHNIAKGLVVDPAGKPLSTAEMKLCQFPALSFCSLQNSDSDGRYSFVLAAGFAWNLYGYIHPRYNDQTYCLELKPDTNGVFASEGGAVRNFQWKLTGLKPDSEATNPHSYYGAMLAISGYLGSAVPNVEVAFTPQGPLVDGSAGKPLTLTSDSGGSIADIPLGRYSITATYVPAGAARLPLLIDAGSGTPATSAVIDFVDQGCLLQPKARISVYSP